MSAVETGERPPTFPRLPAQEEIPGDAEQRDHREVLVDRADSPVQSFSGRSDLNRLAVYQIGAAARTMHAGEDLDERGFSSPVVSEQAMDLCGPHREVDVLERDHRAERFGHAP